MLMNEYRLDPLNDEHSKFLDDEMVKFLALS
jgi:Fe-S cluster biosynthesis and repair protein YggX